jgi:hypothetical protein
VVVGVNGIASKHSSLIGGGGGVNLKFPKLLIGVIIVKKTTKTKRLF